jgi:hypothetical protein
VRSQHRFLQYNKKNTKMLPSHSPVHFPPKAKYLACSVSEIFRPLSAHFFLQQT